MIAMAKERNHNLILHVYVLAYLLILWTMKIPYCQEVNV